MVSPRSRFESVCRIATFGLIGWILGTSLVPLAGRRVQRAANDDVAAALPAWTRLATTVSLDAAFDTVPHGWVVDWLAALRHSGHVVSWHGSPPPVAISSEAVPDPAGGLRVDIAGPQGARVVLRDAIGTIDTLAVNGAGATAELPDILGGVTADIDGQRLLATAPGAAELRPILVMGGAGWEGKFVVSALEERGWPVVARFSVAPGVTVNDGAPPLDTSSVAAVIAIDTTISRLGPELVRYVRSGGGLVLAGPASLTRSVSSLVAGIAGARTHPAVGVNDTMRLGSAGFFPIAHLSDDGIALAGDAGHVSVAARRVGAGRVLQVGYDDTWRWRMAGGSGSEAAHGAWWSRVVASVAYVPHDGLAGSVARAVPASAPLAHLVHVLGPSRVPTQLPARGPLDRRVFLVIIMILLIAEWTSRRVRGLR